MSFTKSKALLYSTFMLIYSGCGDSGTTSTNDSNSDYSLNTNETTISKNTTDEEAETNAEQEIKTTNEPLDYLNSLRVSAGLNKLYLNDKLINSAKSHSTYLDYNNITGHYEESSKEYFTGVYPVDRVFAQNYQGGFIKESVSVGQEDYSKSIDGLLSAIYHRYGLLSSEIDEIGLAQVNRSFTYDMSNSLITKRCQEASYEGAEKYYYKTCKDQNLRIETSDYESRRDTYKKSAPVETLWPSKNAKNIPPVFFEESPDPLPDASVSGYPVSVEFNNLKVSSDISVSSFSLSDKDGNNVPLITLMDKNNDPNDDFTNYQFAIFPKNRLEWGSVYNAHMSYKSNNKDYNINWCFSTKSLNEYASKVYTITDDSSSLNLINNQDYVIYMVPNDNKDIITGFSTRYTQGLEYKYKFIDKNTIYFKLTGEVGNYVEVTLSDNRTVKLTIANSDSAIAPKSSTCN